MPTTSTTPMALPTRATWASGASAWLMATVANGTPSNGNDQRAASHSTSAPGSASHRAHGRVLVAGTRRPATPTYAANSATATRYPGW